MNIGNGWRCGLIAAALFVVLLLTIPVTGAIACPTWPDQASRYLTKADLYDCDCGGLKIARNEIYARHGRIFKTDYLREYFLDQPWYAPDPTNPEGTRGQNIYEQYNRGFILQIEKQRGCNPQ